MAAALSVADSTVSGWRGGAGRREGIPAMYWAALVKRAADLGRSEITLEVLAALAAGERATEGVA